MPPTYEAIVVGLGAMGSASLFHLARRGQRVLGLDQFAPPHTMGSSHGLTRIIREAYFEHPVYVPLLQRAYELWRELETTSGLSLFQQTGGLMIGAPDSLVVNGALHSARQHGLKHELLSAQDVRTRFPALHPADDMLAVFEPRAGVLFPERCISSHLDGARRLGAEVHFNESVIRWAPAGSGDDLTVQTQAGDYSTRRLIVSAGAWVSQLFPELSLPFQIERQLLFWFNPPDNHAFFAPDRCPIHLWQFDGSRFFYGFPETGDGVKVARHHDGCITTPEEVCREISADEVEDMRTVVRRFLPDADGPLRHATVCMYTNTPDGHFWIDRHPEHPQVLIVSPCSGHGFKFSAVIGEMVAKVINDEETGSDLSLFRRR
ncbi:MAG TPA: N-methyl-L-tryptophan oxidase [Verrucomicrobiae bacterium]|nr:N-methyl-L-tryptophan oxidase [Verrucomicrobiae bacterium]